MYNKLLEMHKNWLHLLLQFSPKQKKVANYQKTKKTKNTYSNLLSGNPFGVQFWFLTSKNVIVIKRSKDNCRRGPCALERRRGFSLSIGIYREFDQRFDLRRYTESSNRGSSILVAKLLPVDRCLATLYVGIYTELRV